MVMTLTINYIQFFAYSRPQFWCKYATPHFCAIRGLFSCSFCIKNFVFQHFIWKIYIKTTPFLHKNGGSIFVPKWTTHCATSSTFYMKNIHKNNPFFCAKMGGSIFVPKWTVHCETGCNRSFISLKNHGPATRPFTRELGLQPWSSSNQLQSSPVVSRINQFSLGPIGGF